MIECIGIQEKKGSFVPDGKTESVTFDNVMIYYITDDNPDIVGYFGKELKCKNSRVRKINFNEWSVYPASYHPLHLLLPVQRPLSPAKA